MPFPPFKNSIADLAHTRERKKERKKNNNNNNDEDKHRQKGRSEREKKQRTFLARFSPRATSPRRSCSASRNRCRTSPLKSLDFLSCSRRLWTARISSKMLPRQEREARGRRAESGKKSVRAGGGGGGGGSKRRATLFFRRCCSFCSLAGARLE